MPSVVLIRHAQASFGAADYDVLSERGHEQVRAVVAEVRARGLRPVRVVCGGLVRQRDTARPIAELTGSELRVDPRWDEYATDDLLARHAATDARLEAPGTTSRVFQGVLDDALHAWIAAGADGPAAEPFATFAARVRAALDAVTAPLGSGDTAVVVTSGGVLAAACVALLGVPDAAFVAFNRVAVNGAMTKLACGRSGTSLVSFNEHAHLERDGRSLVTYR